MSNLFQTLEIEAFRAGIKPRTKQSMDWFRRKATQLGRVGKSIMNDEAVKLQTSMKDPEGEMYMFFYDPKHKKTLPYYDKFPLIIMMGPAKGGFYGLNLHYLPPVLRAKVLDALLSDDNKKVALARLPKKYIGPMIKHYLNSNVKSRFALVEKPEWEIATFLPTAQFEKARASTVYAESKRMIK
jgi:hypothetical protein